MQVKITFLRLKSITQFLLIEIASSCETNFVTHQVRTPSA